MTNSKRFFIIIFAFTLSISIIWLFSIDDIKSKSEYYPKQSLPTSVIFSEEPMNPTILTIDEYYQVQNSGIGHTFYLQFFLESGEVYFICNSWRTLIMALYDNSDFTGEITSNIEGEWMCFAPMTSKNFYLLWDNVKQDHKIGIFKARLCSSTEISNGITTQFNDNDWGYSVIHFIIPSNDVSQTKDGNCRAWTLINRNSSEAKNFNQINSGSVGNDDLTSHPNAGILLLMQYEGTYKLNILGIGDIGDIGGINLDIGWIIFFCIAGFAPIIGGALYYYSKHKHEKTIYRKRAWKPTESLVTHKPTSTRTREQAVHMIVPKKELKMEQKKKEQAFIDKVKKLMSVSTRMRIDMFRDFLELDPKEFNEKIIDWAGQFGFTIDGDYINIRQERISDFIDELEKQFDMWNREESNKSSKM